MKVKELIENLQKLDLEKEIKSVVAGGYEYEEETNSEIKVMHYKEDEETDCDGLKFHTVNDYDFEDKEKDFYLIR